MSTETRYRLTHDLHAESANPAIANETTTGSCGYVLAVLTAGSLLRSLSDQQIDPFMAELVDDEEDARQWAAEASEDDGATWYPVRWHGPAAYERTA
jgi:hypothetical protein